MLFGSISPVRQYWKYPFFLCPTMEADMEVLGASHSLVLPSHVSSFHIQFSWTRTRRFRKKLSNIVLRLLGPSLTLLNDGVEQASPFFECPALEDDGIKQLQSEGAKAAIGHLVDALQAERWTGTDLDQAKTLLGDAAKAAGVKKGVVMKSLRAALLGRLQGPDLLTTWSLLAKIGDDLPRLQRCLS